MRSELGQTFETLGLYGHVVSRSDTSLFVRFETGEFLSVTSGCEGEWQYILTLGVQSWMANSKSVESVRQDLAANFDLDPAAEILLNVCEPIKLKSEAVLAQVVPAPGRSWNTNTPAEPSPWFEFAPEKTNEKVYSVPRRYDLASMMVISAAYAILFSIMRSLNTEDKAAALIGTFFAVVGASQAILFKGNAPRAASILSGGVCAVCFVILYGFIARVRPGSVPPFAVGAIFWGPIAGYLAGAMIGGIWLIADNLRPLLERRTNLHSDTATDAEHHDWPSSILNERS